MPTEEPTVIAVVQLGPQHAATGFTKHSYGTPGETMPIDAPASLRIQKYPDDDGFLLVHYDGDGVELTDTYHGSPQDAKEQARLEFSVEPGEWQDA